MCDICGFVSRAPRSSAAILPMTARGRHRGPDDEGYLLVRPGGAPPDVRGGTDTPLAAYHSGAASAPARAIDADDVPVTLALGHRRLSIVDLSVLGHQPMCTPDRRFWIIYNGEIHNYVELGAELAVLGHQFASHSDTEVILAAYAQWGADSLHRLNGMWAFAIYDAHAGELFLARDRFGIKPLYYWVAPDGTFCFASEIKQFTAMPGWKAAVNAPRAIDFLSTGLTDHTDETLFAGVFHLRAGHCMRLSIADFQVGRDGRVANRRWYDLQPAPFTGSFDEAVAECRRLLTDSVRLMLRADVPVGSCLSGGLDSSSIVGVLSLLLADQGSTGLQKTFSALSDVAALDERSWIETVVRAAGVDGHNVTPTMSELAAEASAMAWHQDEPCTSSSVFAQWSVFKLAAAQHVKVMLDGQGADEAFAGYHSYFAPYLAGLLRAARFGDLWREFGHLKRRHGYSERRALAGIVRRMLPGADHDMNSVQSMSRAQLTSSNLQMLLRFEDRNSMAHSVEARVPFLDHRLVEFALGLPDNFKLGGGVTKRVLRSSMSHVLPARVRDRVDKLAFETPEEHWLRGEGRPWFRDHLRAAIDASQGLLPATGTARLDEMIAGTRPFDRTPWRMISFGEWMQTFSVGVVIEPS